MQYLGDEVLARLDLALSHPFSESCQVVMHIGENLVALDVCAQQLRDDVTAILLSLTIRANLPASLATMAQSRRTIHIEAAHLRLGRLAVRLRLDQYSSVLLLLEQEERAEAAVDGQLEQAVGPLHLVHDLHHCTD